MAGPMVRSESGRPFDPEVAARYRAQGWWGHRSLADWLEDHARRDPNGDAFISGDLRMSWRAYQEASDELAGALMAAGLPRGSRLAVRLPDGPAVHVAFMAAEKAGLTTVGIGARAGRREVSHLLQRTGARVLVTLSSHAGVPAEQEVAELRREGLALDHLVVVAPDVHAVGLEGIRLDGEPAAGLPAGERSRLIAGRRLGPDDLFIINSTSGTTGMPKCVQHTQNRHVYINEMAKMLADLTSDDVFLGAVPAPFGFGLWTAHFTPTLLGAATVLMERFDAAEALRLVARERVTVLCCVSTQFIMMLNSPECTQVDLTSLRVMFTGGEAIPFERAREFEERTGASVLQFYGSNESGVVTGTSLRDPADIRLRTSGRVLPGTELRLFRDGRDVTAEGRGQPGSRGPATCLGYLDDPAANAELFTDDGFVLHADECTLDQGGALRVVGRTADLIIRGGKNISASVVEGAVLEHPAVALAAAVAAPDPVFGERVAVFVELRPGQSLTLEQLVEFLMDAGASKETLPEYLVVRESLPRSSGAKVAKGDLRREAAELANVPGAPGTSGGIKRAASP